MSTACHFRVRLAVTATLGTPLRRRRSRATIDDVSVLAPEQLGVERRTVALTVVASGCLTCFLIGFWLPVLLADRPGGLLGATMGVAAAGMLFAPLIGVVVFVEALTGLVTGWQSSSWGRRVLLAWTLVDVAAVWASTFAIVTWFLD